MTAQRHAYGWKENYIIRHQIMKKNIYFNTPLKKVLYSALLAMFATCPVFAQDAEDAMWTYEVKQGDTLYDISDMYIEDPSSWPLLAQDAKVKEPKHLQPGQLIRIPVDLLRHDKKPLRVAYLRGEVLIAQKNQAPRPLEKNMLIQEGQTITTGQDGFVSLKLPDETDLLISAGSVLHIGQFRYVPDVNKTLIDFVLDSGHIETKVTPQPPNSQFRVTTPVAVTAVRGTKFGVGMNKDGTQQINDVIQGTIEVGGKKNASSQRQSVFVNAGEGSYINAGSSSAEVLNLLAAPDLSGWPKLLHEEQWQPASIQVASANGYAVQVFPEGEKEHVIFESRGELVPIGPFSNNKNYIITVRALDSYDIPGQIAEHKVLVKTEPIPPLLQIPGDQQKLVLKKQEFVCTNVPSVRKYLVQISDDADFKNIIYQDVSQEDCRFGFQPKNEGTYYWRTASVSNSSPDVEIARGQYSAVGQFEAVAQPPAPEWGSSMEDKGVVIRWAEVEPGSTYQVEVSDKIDFSNILLAQETQDVMLPLDVSVECSALYVRIKTVLPDGVVSDFSAPRIIQGMQKWCTQDGVVLVDGQGDPINVER